MFTINEMKEEIRNLRGANVRVFGQPTTLADSVDDFTIDIIDVLDALAEYEVDLSDYTDYNEDDEDYVEFDLFNGDETIDEVLDILEYNGYIRDVCDYKGDNSYNWSSPISNDFDIKIYKDLMGGEFIEFKVHRYGDVRCNYTDSVLLHFNDDYTFSETLLECSKYKTIEVDGVNYSLDVNIFNDCFEVYDEDGGDYICSAYGWDEDDVRNCIREKINK